MRNDAWPRVEELPLSTVERGELFRRAARSGHLPESAGANERDAVVGSPGGTCREFRVMLDRGDETVRQRHPFQREIRRDEPQRTTIRRHEDRVGVLRPSDRDGLELIEPTRV